MGNINLDTIVSCASTGILLGSGLILLALLAHWVSENATELVSSKKDQNDEP